MGRAGPRPPPGPGGEAGRSARRRRQPDAGMRAFSADSHRISGRQLFGAPLGELGGPGITSRTQAFRPDGRVQTEDGAADPNSTRESQGPGHPRVRRGQGRRRPARPATRSTSQPRTAWSAGSRRPPSATTRAPPCRSRTKASASGIRSSATTHPRHRRHRPPHRHRRRHQRRRLTRPQAVHISPHTDINHRFAPAAPSGLADSIKPLRRPDRGGLPLNPAFAGASSRDYRCCIIDVV